VIDLRLLAGIGLGFGIGLGCRLSGTPVPAPPVLVGALLVVAMTCGYLLADRRLAARPAQQTGNCGGPDGRPRQPPS
jgi:XapX domain-containing protein